VACCYFAIVGLSGWPVAATDRAINEKPSAEVGSDNRPMRFEREPERLRRAKEVIDTSYFEPLDVAALARTALLSPAHFSRLFRRAFGTPPHQYLIARRMERAAVLLRTTDRPVNDICRTVGLRSVGSFTTRFSRTFGTAPTVYRAAHARPHVRESRQVP
jgi:AraC-like DNA-binding protein